MKSSSAARDAAMRPRKLNQISPVPETSAEKISPLFGTVDSLKSDNDNISSASCLVHITAV